jgi:Translation initiation factor 2, alpha subunit (eIF-2alpha)
MNYYSKTIPDINDVIIVKIKKIIDGGIYGVSIEYPSFEIYIPPTEIAKKKVNIYKKFSPDKYYPVIVLDIHKKNNLFVVSYMKIGEDEKKERLERFHIYQKIYKLGQELTLFHKKFTNNESESKAASTTIYQKLIWPILDNLYTDYLKLTLQDVTQNYNKILEDPKSLFINIESDNEILTEDLINVYINNLKKRIRITEMIMEVSIKIIVLEDNAVNKLKLILKENINELVKIEYISSPNYKLLVSGFDRNKLEELLNDSILCIKKNCEKYNASFKEENIKIQKEKIFSVSDYNAN